MTRALRITKISPASELYTTKSATLINSLPHTGTIILEQIDTCNLFGSLCTDYPILLNTKSDTKGVVAHKTFPSNDKVSKCHINSYFLPLFQNFLQTNHLG